MGKAPPEQWLGPVQGHLASVRWSHGPHWLPGLGQVTSLPWASVSSCVKRGKLAEPTSKSPEDKKVSYVSSGQDSAWHIVGVQ